MADIDHNVLGQLNYYSRNNYYQTMQTLAQESLRRNPSDHLLKFLSGFASLMLGSIPEAMRDFELVRDKRDMNLCTSLALMLAHKMCENVDKEAYGQLDAKLKEERRQASDRALFYAGLFLFHCKKYDKAPEYVDRALKQSPKAKEILCLKAWTELLLNPGDPPKPAMEMFEQAIQVDSVKTPDVMFGKAKYQEIRKNFAGALETINQTIVAFPQLTAAIVEKMRLQLCLQDWDQAVETAQRCISLDSHCLEAHKYNTLKAICFDGDYVEAGNRLGELSESLNVREGNNAALHVEIAQLISRVCGRNDSLLQQTYSLVEMAVRMQPGHNDYLTELGFQCLLRGLPKDSQRCFSQAMHRSVPDLNALQNSVSDTNAAIGTAWASVALDKTADAKQRLEELLEVDKASADIPAVCYLQAVIQRKTGGPAEARVALLSKALDGHLVHLNIHPLGPDFFMALNADFVIEICQEYLHTCSDSPLSEGQQAPLALKKCDSVLRNLCKFIPGLVDGLYQLARVKFLMGDDAAAQSVTAQCLARDQSFADAYILLSQIHLYKNNHEAAHQALEQGLGYNFHIKEHPIYQLIKARILRQKGEADKAVQMLKTALQASKSVSRKDRASLYLELMAAHLALKQQVEATRALEDGLREFAGSPEEIQLQIASSELALSTGDVAGAQATLRSITADQPYFVEAQEKLAALSLKHLQDKKAYIRCYKTIHEKHPSLQTLLLLGNAHMTIQESEKAIEVYEAALKRNPSDHVLASKIGEALVKTHNYAKAISYYEAAIRGSSVMYADLVDLLLKLRQFDKAEKVLTSRLSSLEQPTNLSDLIEQSRLTVLMARYYSTVGRATESTAALERAKAFQIRVLKRCTVEQPDLVPEQQVLASSICCDYAERLVQKQELAEAVKCYREAASYFDQNGRVNLHLAQLYLLQEEYTKSKEMCVNLLHANLFVTDATLIIADLLVRQNDYEGATEQFQSLVKQDASNYSALSRLLSLLRRAGKLADAEAYLQLAESSSTRHYLDAGYNYCRGLYEWYSGSSSKALKSLNKARKDGTWGEPALCLMIEICLNPEQQVLGGEFLGEGNVQDDPEKLDSDQMALKTAEKLIKELKVKQGSYKKRVYECFLLIRTQRDTNINKALEVLQQIVSEYGWVASAGYCLAVGYQLISDPQRSKMALKNLVNRPWTSEEADWLERSCLLAADLGISAGKLDSAQELLELCIKNNQSCVKAHEYLGALQERSKDYEGAADSYDAAWLLSGKTNANVGYKLAITYLKTKQWVSAVEVCLHILKEFPQYPKLRKEVLERARSNIRV